jgi:hypothetical protein
LRSPKVRLIVAVLTQETGRTDREAAITTPRTASSRHAALLSVNRFLDELVITGTGLYRRDLVAAAPGGSR